MVAPIGTLEDTIARLRSQLGVSWPNPWWPTGIPAFNDCAAFQSWGLFGLNGHQPYQTLVSGLVERSGLEFHAGHAGIQRGDILGLRWSATVNYDHTGMALGPPNAAGVIQTIDANGGTNKVAISNRAILNVHNFARPNYARTGTAGSGSTGLNNQSEVTTLYARRDSTGLIALFNGTGQHDFASLTDYKTHRTILSTYNAQAVNAGDQQFVPPEDPGQVIGLDETGWASVVAMYGARTVAGGGTPADYYSDSDAARDLKATVDSIAATQKTITEALAAIKFPTKGTVELA